MCYFFQNSNALVVFAIWQYTSAANCSFSVATPSLAVSIVFVSFFFSFLELTGAGTWTQRANLPTIWHHVDVLDFGAGHCQADKKHHQHGLLKLATGPTWWGTPVPHLSCFLLLWFSVLFFYILLLTKGPCSLGYKSYLSRIHTLKSNFFTLFDACLSSFCANPCSACPVHCPGLPIKNKLLMSTPSTRKTHNCFNLWFYLFSTWRENKFNNIWTSQ